MPPRSPTNTEEPRWGGGGGGGGGFTLLKGVSFLKAHGMAFPATSLTTPSVAPTDLRDLSFTGCVYPSAHQHMPSRVVVCAPCSSTVDSIPHWGCSSTPSRSSHKNSRLEKLGSTFFFGAHQMTLYGKYSVKSESGPSCQLLKLC